MTLAQHIQALIEQECSKAHSHAAFAMGRRCLQLGQVRTSILVDVQPSHFHASFLKLLNWMKDCMVLNPGGDEVVNA